MQPDPTKLIEIIGINNPLIGLYDAPDVSKFKPVVTPEPDNHICVFSFYENWLNGETLHITKDNFGCGGAANYLCGTEIIPHEMHVQFLVEGEGLKASHDLMISGLIIIIFTVQNILIFLLGRFGKINMNISKA